MSKKSLTPVALLLFWGAALWPGGDLFPGYECRPVESIPEEEEAALQPLERKALPKARNRTPRGPEARPNRNPPIQKLPAAQLPSFVDRIGPWSSGAHFRSPT